MATAALDTFPLGLIAELEPTLFDAIAFGDTDRDGWNEVVIYIATDTSYSYRILEEQGGNVYSVEYTGAPLIPYATGDLDQDGKTEIIGQRASRVHVYESVDSTSYPTELVWSSQVISNVVGRATTGDTDRDGRMEIITSQNFFGGNANLIIFENTGDNTYDQVYSGTIFGNASTGEKVIADLDGDGLVEIALIGSGGWVHVFESPANDTWEVIWSEWTGMYNSYAAEGGQDTDGNGKPELFVSGNLYAGGTEYYTTMVYEASGNNTFAQVATISPTTGCCVPYNALANLDNVGFHEYVMATGNLWIYRASSEAQWDLVGTATGPRSGRVYTFDINQNGKPELIWEGNPPSTILVLEHPITSDVGDDLWPRHVSLSVFPNPCRLEARLRVPESLLGAARLSVFDAAGRLVERRLLIGGPGGHLLWPTQRLSSGVYLLRLESTNGKTLATGRGIVVR